MPYFLLNNTASYSKKSSVDKLYDVSVKSINCVCARTNKQFILIDTPNTENGIKWCEHAILWEFEVFEDCGNCIAMEQSGYISEWQNLLLTLTSYDVGVKRYFDPSDTELLRALHSRNSKNIRNPLIFLQKMASYSCFGGSQVQKSYCKQACVGFLTF